MNIILFTENECCNPLPADDPRAVHILTVLRRKKNDSFDAGIINGAKGKGIIRDITPAFLHIDFVFDKNREPEQLYPVVLVAGFARPQTARKILQEATTLGVSGIYFVRTEKTEASYRESSLWTSGEYKRHLVAGAEQAFSTLIPKVQLFDSLEVCLASLQGGVKIALDNYEAGIALSACCFDTAPVHLFIGPEKGWSDNERDFFRSSNIVLAGLGKRVLRSETASVAAIVSALSGMGFM